MTYLEELEAENQRLRQVLADKESALSAAQSTIEELQQAFRDAQPLPAIVPVRAPFAQQH